MMDFSMRRRDILEFACATALIPAVAEARSSTDRPRTSETSWRALDGRVRNWWGEERNVATEDALRAPEAKELLFLPFPYEGPTGTRGVYTQMFAWDTHFINLGLLAHGKSNFVADHIRNYAAMIDRFGYMPNANHRSLLSRSQTPIFVDGIWRYYLATRDSDLIFAVYPALVRQYRGYWLNVDHRTPTGLATACDNKDPGLPPSLASEAETGLDWTPIYDGDVRRCVPLIINAALTRYAVVLSNMANLIGKPTEARQFENEAEHRRDLIRRYCWSQTAGFFFEYDFVAGRQLPYVSTCALWMLWSGVATAEQAKQLAAHLNLLEQPHGLSETSKSYPDDRVTALLGLSQSLPGMPVEGLGGHGWLNWMYPAGWANMQMVAVDGLDRYGFHDDAFRIADKFLNLIVSEYDRTGFLWEKYNVVDGSIVLPNSRAGNLHMHGWTAASVAVLGQRVFGSQT